MFVMLEVLFERPKAVKILTISPWDWNPPYTSVALMAQYLNVRQRKLNTIIIQTVHILLHDSVWTQGHRPGGIFAWRTQITKLPARQKYR